MITSVNSYLGIAVLRTLAEVTLCLRRFNRVVIPIYEGLAARSPGAERKSHYLGGENRVDLLHQRSFGRAWGGSIWGQRCSACRCAVGSIVVFALVLVRVAVDAFGFFQFRDGLFAAAVLRDLSWGSAGLQLLGQSRRRRQGVVAWAAKVGRHCWRRAWPLRGGPL